MKILLILAVLFGVVDYTFAQEQFMFKKLETKDGLSHSQINSIFKDSRGFMWFSTASGLNRYDGYEFKVYQHDENDPHSLSDTFVDDIQEDANGNLWIHIPTAYLVYDVHKEIFIRDITPILAEYGVTGTVDLLYIDNEKNMWFGMAEGGVYQYQLESKTVHYYPQGGEEELSKGTLTWILEDGNNVLFLFNNGLLEVLHRSTGKVVTRYNYIPENSTTLSDKYTLFKDTDGDYWIYARNNSGLWLYRSNEQKWEHITNQPGSKPFALSSNVIQGIEEDNNKRIWIATDHGGINIICKSTNSILNLQHDINDERSLLQNSINCLYHDDMDIMWVGTYKRGISYYSESLFKFEVNHLSHLRRNNFEPDITVVENDNHDNLWIGTNGNGLIYINRATGEMKHYEHNPAVPSSVAGDIIVALCCARDGKLWVGTYLGGMSCFDGKSFTHYRHIPENPNSIASNDVWAIKEDEDGAIWIGTLGGGLQRLDPRTGKFTTFQGSNTLSSDYISSLYIGDNTIYVGTAVGINLFNKTNETIEKLEGNKAGTQKFSNLNTQQVYLDSRGLLWVSTRDGLNILDRKSDHITILRKTDGLADNFICGIIEDNDKNMWVTTANGVSNIVINANPRTGEYTYTCYNYDELDGLQGQEFNLRSITKTKNGDIVMGGINGFNVFNPHTIKYNESQPQVLFTDFRLFNQEIKVDAEYNGNKILASSIAQTNKIELEYKQNVFSVGFSGMNYILPEKAKYLCMLEGFSTDWLPVDGNVHRVTYTNLAPGTYTLKVKAANSDGYWNEKASELTIVIHPPFWLSTWAYLIYFLIVLAILWFARFMLLRNERNKFKLKQVELEAERQHELDDMKLRFFTNISHELRTPLSLIISPLDNMIKHATNNDNKEKLLLMRRNAIRLLNMVNQLLDFRKNDVKGHKLNLSTGDVIPLLRGICQSFAELSDKKKIRFTFISSVESLIMDFDEDKISKIMMNLLSNAFKFTPNDGSVEVRVAMLPANGDTPRQLQVNVIDTGEGIKDEDKEHVFERFYQVNSTSSHASGSGIGLHLAKEFVKLHEGNIFIQDNNETGSIFTFNIPATLRNITSAETDSPMEMTVLQAPEEILSEENEDNSLASDIPLILIVDDNDDFRSFMRSSLIGEYNIREASNGQEAWEMLPELQPDIIISDVMMPSIDGIELARKVKNDLRTSHIPLILLTARTAEEHKVEGLETGADDYLTKPFNFDILSLRIKKLLELRNLKQEKFNKQIEPVPSEITITSLDEKLIGKAIKYVEENLSRSELSVEELSRELGMSRVHLYKKLTAITGKTPIEFIRTIRLKRAAQFLQKSQMNISEIAYEVGFNNPKYFSKYFREEFGVLPSEYNKKEGR
ncbi:hybrid sensor histidine kinase/response regulator transcription factor [Bacteroides sp. 519]|uniref:hybrid sensor histidine kinase/response regulator transcription factor n=1 Tax=Bacteroides sp. 519 TaxID=2302937 RepID=UPI0013D6DBB7|nr:hybrid sensor histidine kinase/response regulator transcription factor [Bacteroides sp. 519]NDV60014.1 hybrid sensor histidine kinase/response regulator [Bacteroides sp. 519]